MAKRDQKALVQLKVRMRETLRLRLEALAIKRGSSINAEVVDRLERSFDRSDLLAEVLSLTFGSQPAGFLLVLGFLMSPVVFARKERDHLVSEDWVADPKVQEGIRLAFRMTLQLYAADPKEVDFAWAAEHEDLMDIAEIFLTALAGSKEDMILHQHVEMLNKMLGPAATRMLTNLPKLEKARRTVPSRWRTIKKG